MKIETIIMLIMALESIAVLLMALKQEEQERHIAMLFKAIGMMIDITGDWLLGTDEDKERARCVYVKMSEDENKK